MSSAANIASRVAWPIRGSSSPASLVRRLASPIAGWGAIAALVALALIMVRITGGSPNPANHLGYVSILLAAYLFGFRGGLATSLAVALSLGPGEAALREAVAPDELHAWLTRAAMFVAVGGVAGFLFDRVRMTSVRLEGALEDVTERQRAGAVALARAAEARDHTTGEHIFRCRDLASALALETGMTRDLAEDVGWAAMLHDIGKLHVPDRVLLKPGSLSPEEWGIMRSHSVYGERILAGGAGFEMARRIARWHHEDVDGGGYPDRLRGDAIPLEARIVRIADAYDAMTHERPYKAAQSPEWAFEELERYAGRQFDPELVRLFIALLERDIRLRVGELLPGTIVAALPDDDVAA